MIHLRKENIMNKVIITGRLTAAPNFIEKDNGVKIANFSTAISRQYKGPNGEHKADYVKVICFNHNATFVEKYCQKGDMVAVVGKIQTGSYVDKDGRTVYTTDIVADNVELLKKHEPKVAEPESKPRESIYDALLEDDDEDLPF